jgi:hypothetical protein
MLTKGLWMMAVAVMGVALVTGGAWAAEEAAPAKEPAKVEAKAPAKVEAKEPAKVEAKAEPKAAEVKMNDAAAKTVAEVFPKAKVSKVEVGKGPGIDIYDVTMKDEKDVEFNVAVASEGTIVGVKTKVAEKDLPAAVAKALKDAKADLAKVEKIELRAMPSEVDGKAKITKLEKAKIIYSSGDVGVNEDGTPAGGPETKAPETKAPPAKAPEAPKAEKAPAAK